MSELTKREIQEIKIEQNDIEKISSSLDQAFEVAQNSLIVQKNVALSKGALGGFDNWKKEQKVVKQQLKKDIKTSVNNITKIIDESLNNTILQLNALGEKITDKDIKKVGNKTLLQKTNKAIRIMGDKVLSDYEKSVAKVYRLKNTDELYNAILEQTKNGIENGVNITYRDGKQVSFKSYMEMNVRTTVRQEANEYLFNASKENGVVFYVCDFYGDCAEDHADYQGRYYYDEEWESFGYNEETSKRIQDYIDSYGMLSYQSVVNNEPFLTTRPNCRHSLRPVVIDDVFNNTDKQMTEKYGIRKGTYNDDNYKALQTQRRNERIIRKYKTRLIEHQQQQKNMQSPKLKTQIAKDKALIKKWNEIQEEHLSNNPQLKRDKRREDNRVLVQDLGAGYHLGLKIDGRNMYFKETIKEPIKVNKVVKKKTIEEIEKTLDEELKNVYGEYDKIDPNGKLSLGEEERIKNKLRAEVYKKYQEGVANTNNFYYNTYGVFEKAIKPDREPDYVSYSNGKISSRYWYTKNGVIRGSDHWGGSVASCSWYLKDSKMGSNITKKYSSVQYGEIKWEDFVFMSTIVKINNEKVLLSFKNVIGKQEVNINNKIYKFNVYTLQWEEKNK